MSEQEKATALIVDDNPTNLNVLFNSLSTAGFKVLVAQDGPSALQQAQQARPDVILLDVMMPGMDGFETCNRLKHDAATAQVPVIFMTALHETSDKIKGFQTGAVDYVTKPLQHEEVIARISTHLRLRRLQNILERKTKELEAKNRELKKNYEEISRLQEAAKGYLSNRAWQSIESDENEISRYEQLTILMSDIEGFTPLLDKCDSRTILKHLNYYMDILANAIYANNGEIDKFLGDGILGFFQMPHDAVQAAMDIQNQIRVFNKLRVNGLNIPLNTRIGLATGKILLARVGSQLRKEYTLIGDRVNVAARIQSIAPAGGLSMDETTYQTLGHIPGLIPDFISLKGKQKRELIYSVQPESISKLAEFTQTPTQI